MFFALWGQVFLLTRSSMSDLPEMPYETLEAREDGAPYFFSCEHAGRAVPAGFDVEDFGHDRIDSHNGWDPGAGHLTRGLADRLGSGAILGRWTRLLVDLNRSPADRELIRRSVEGLPVPANLELTPLERSRRLRLFFDPFHRVFDLELDRVRSTCGGVVLVSVHSFTPVLEGRRRPMEFGLLFDRHPEYVADLGRFLQRAGHSVAYNAPYSGRDGKMYSAIRHGRRNRVPHYEIEVRNDLLFEDGAAIERLLAEGLESSLR